MEMGFRGFIVILVVIGAFIAAGFGMGVSELAAIGAVKVRGTEVTIGDATVRATVAKTSVERAKGLSGRAALGENEGMLFVFQKPERQAFWMKGMKISIDIIWIRGGAVIGAEEKVAPPSPDTSDALLKRYASPGLVDMALEVQSGFVEKHRVRLGDKVTLPGI